MDSIVKGSKQGVTQRATLEQVAKSGKQIPELEISKKPPKQLFYLWQWYRQELQWSSPLSFQEIKAWSELRLCSITASEAYVLQTLDKHYRNSHGS